jgi:hypothetical protein
MASRPKWRRSISPVAEKSARVRQGGEHECQVGLDRMALVVIDRSGLRVMLGHPKTTLEHPTSASRATPATSTGVPLTFRCAAT